MHEHPPLLSPDFLDSQRSKLRALRNQILKVSLRNDTEQRTINEEANEHALEREDDAQRLAANETDGNLSLAEEARLATIERALQKIEEGSYGVSEDSGAPIPMARLLAFPEALLTRQEQELLDQQRVG